MRGLARKASSSTPSIIIPSMLHIFWAKLPEVDGTRTGCRWRMKMEPGRESLESLTSISLFAPFDCANVCVALEMCVCNVVGILTKIRRLTFLSATNAQIVDRGKSLRHHRERLKRRRV